MSWLPNIDISPLLEWAWWLLQFSIQWVGVLCLLVFVLVLIAGAGDILADIFRQRRARRDKSQPRRMHE